MTDSLLVRLNNSLLAAGKTHTEFCAMTGLQWEKLQEFRNGLPVSKYIRNRIARGINDLKPLIDPETAPVEVPAPAVQTSLEDVPEEAQNDQTGYEWQYITGIPPEKPQTVTISHVPLEATKPTLSETERRIFIEAAIRADIPMERKILMLDTIYQLAA